MFLNPFFIIRCSHFLLAEATDCCILLQALVRRVEPLGFGATILSYSSLVLSHSCATGNSESRSAWLNLRPLYTSKADFHYSSSRGSSFNVFAYSGSDFTQFTSPFFIVNKSHVSFFLNEWCARSTLPCDCGWYGRPLTSFIPSLLQSFLTAPGPWSCWIIYLLVGHAVYKAQTAPLEWVCYFFPPMVSANDSDYTRLSEKAQIWMSFLSR